MTTPHFVALKNAAQGSAYRQGTSRTTSTRSGEERGQRDLASGRIEEDRVLSSVIGKRKLGWRKIATPAKTINEVAPLPTAKTLPANSAVHRQRSLMLTARARVSMGSEPGCGAGRDSVNIVRYGRIVAAQESVQVHKLHTAINLP